MTGPDSDARAIEEIAQALRANDLLCRADARETASLAAQAHIEALPAGAVLLREGDAPGGAYLFARR